MRWMQAEQESLPLENFYEFLGLAGSDEVMVVIDNDACSLHMFGKMLRSADSIAAAFLAL